MDVECSLGRYAIRVLLVKLLLLQAGFAAMESPQLPAPDPVSVQCLGCHDGVSAVDVMSHAASPGGAPYGAGHGIGMRYASVIERRPDSFRHPLTAGSQILLVSGRVSCVSCHSNSSKTAATPAAFTDTAIAQQCMVASQPAETLAAGQRCLACHLE